jgi:putative transposase
MSSPQLTKGRRSEIGQYYVVTTNTHARSPLFRHAIAARCVIAAMKHAEESGTVATISWVVMPDHLHWMFSLTASTLSEVVQRTKVMSANDINLALNRRGAVWQAGFFDHRVRDESSLQTHARYIIENPVRAGIVSSIDAYADWGCVGFRGRRGVW